MGFFERAKRALFGGSPPAPAEQAVVSAAATHGANPGSPEQAFVDQVVAVLRLEERLTHVEQDPENVFSLRVWLDDQEEPIVLFLHNLRNDTLESPPAERQASIDRFIRVLTQDNSTDWAEVEGNLVPLLRSAAFLAYIEAGPLARPFAGHLSEVVGIDRPDSTMITTVEQLAAWPIDVDQAFADARTRMASSAYVEEFEAWDADAVYSMWQLTAEDSYESSRLALPGWLAAQAARVEGAPLCIIPTRSLLVLAGDQDPAAVCRLFETALGEFQSGSRMLSPMVYAVGETGEVIEYQPPQAHPARALHNRNRLMFDLAEYEEQKQGLDERFAERDIDVFVARLNVVTTDDEETEYRSYTVWVDGVHTLLPKADFIAVTRSTGGDEQQDHFMVTWDTAQAIAGELMQEEPGMLPKRWRLKAFPQGSTLEALRAAATEL